MEAVRAAVDAVFRDEWGRIVATLIRLTGDWDLAEECAQDAFTQALAKWPADGVPRNPGAWLTTAARNRAIDRLRRATAETGRLRSIAPLTEPTTEPTLDRSCPDPFTAAATRTPAAVVGPAASGSDAASDPDGGLMPDDRLRLIFTCCHPALPLDARVALTLRTLTGLTTPEIARAFLIPEATLAQRLVRAKRKIRNARIPYRIPDEHLLPDRLAGVLAVLYLLFNEGYTTGREPLAAEAIRLTRLLTALMPDEPEPRGLLALMLLHHARRTTRTDATGNLVTLSDQDRSQWDQTSITEGVRLIAASPGRGAYRIQAAIAACHATAPRAEDTDWPEIAALYGELARLTPSPIVELNRAVAIAEADGPQAALPLLDRLAEAPELSRYHLLPATRAELLRRLNRFPEAADAYRTALTQAPTEAERRFLTTRLTTLPPAAPPEIL